MKRQFYGGLLLTIIGGLLLGLTLSDAWDSRQMKTWPVVTGHIDTGTVYPVRIKYLRAYYKDVFRQRLSYSYTAGGAAYSGMRLYSPGSDAEPQWDNEIEALNALPAAGAKVMVHYDPAYPADAVLYVLPVSWGRCLSSVVLLIIGICLLLLFFRSYRQNLNRPRT